MALAAASSFVVALADDKQTQERLRERGLKRVGAMAVLDGELALRARIKNLRKLWKECETAQRQHDHGAAQSEAQLNQLLTRRRDLSAMLAQVNQGPRNRAAAQANNRLVAEINALSDQIALLHRQTQAGDALAGAEKAAGAARDRFLQELVDLQRASQEVTARYEELAADADLRSELSAAGREGQPLELGPTRTFAKDLAALKELSGNVFSESIPLKQRGGVNLVDVAINGQNSVPMILDTGASTVAISMSLANKLGLTPGPDAPAVEGTLADGRAVPGRRIFIREVRLGHAAVENVECIVLSQGLADADALLGGSFLREFKVELDAKAKQLKLTRLGSGEPPGLKSGP